MRVRFTFAKTEAMRFTSHLDLHRAWERTFRRASLPLSYTQGFRPHPRLNIASALPLGFTSEGEVMDAWLDQAISIEHIQKRLERTMPPGLRISGIEEVDPHTPALQAEMEASEFTLTLLEPALDLGRKVEEILDAERLMRERRGKCYDLRPLILDLHLLSEDKQGLQMLSALLSARERATGRPEEVAAALGLSPGRVRFHRKWLVFRQTGQGK